MNAAPATVDEYIQSFPPSVQSVLRIVRAAVKQAAPQAEERISYRMPALFLNGAVVYFGAFKSHLGLFPPVEDPALIT
uniref:iron chaperone n=1 Tax=Arcanobacterium phocae TaxID=131112 RepID=UPI001C10F33A